MTKKTTKFRPFVLPLIAVAIFVCLASINLRTSIWFDEAYSAYLIRGDYSQIWNMTAIDVHPPFYYFLLKTWSLIFGTSDFALRFMSVFFGAIAIVLAYKVLKRWFGDKVAGISTLLLSMSPFMVRYGQEMRMYMVVFAIIMGATWALDVALKNKSKKAWLIYAVLVSLGMWTHYFTALAWLAHLIYIVLYMRKHGLQKSIFWTYPLAVGLFLPWMPLFIKQYTDVQGGFWIPEVSANSVVSIFSQGLLGQDADGTTNWLIPLFLATICAIVACIIKTWRVFKTKEKTNLWFLITMTLVPPLLLILLSLPPLKPTFVPRYVTYSISLLMALIGVFVAWTSGINKLQLAQVTLALVLICATIGIFTATMRTVESSTVDIIADVKYASEVEEPIFIDTDEMNYYDAFFYETKKNPIYGTNIDYKWGSLEPIRKYGQNDGNNIEERINDVESFWYVTDNKEKEVVFDGFTVTDDRENNDYYAFRFVKTNN